MEAWLVSIAALIGLAFVGIVALRARRQVAEIRTAVSASGDPATAVRTLVKRADRTERARADEGVVVAVADHGVGIPRIAQARIFERFYEVDRARVRGGAGGTGLGLAIARHIVEQHGGRIWVDSTERTGSTFAFSVPVDPALGS